MNKELDLLEIARMVRKQILWLLLIPGVAVLIGGIISFFIITPMYETSTTLFLEEMTYKLHSYTSIALSQPVIGSSLSGLNTDLTDNQLRKMLTVSEKDANLIVIHAKNKDPKLAQSIANQMAKSFIDVITSESKVKKVTIVNEAIFPLKPKTPNRLKNIVVAGVLGVMFSAAFVFIEVLLDNNIKNIAEIKQLGISVLGTLPVFEDMVISSNNGLKYDISENFHVLRTNLHFSQLDKQIKSLVITSSTSLEGTTFIAINLAIAFAQTGLKVLLIDGNLRRPKIHETLSLENLIGFADLLEEDEIEAAVQPSALENLYVITSGSAPISPAIALSSSRTENLIRSFERKYDLVIIDAPPVTDFSDASALSAVASGALMNIGCRRVSYDVAKKAISQLKMVNANIIGAVLNRSSF